MARATTKPDWDALFETASTQEGHFSTAQAGDAGFSPQLLAHHLRKGRIRRVRRKVYRLTHFPAGDHEDLVVVWLWSDRQGVFSLETALFLQGFSDAMPSRIYLTLPSSWSGRRLRTPRGVVTSYAEIEPSDRTWVGCLPVTGPGRTLDDCIEAAVSPEIVVQALQQASDRGLIDSRTQARIRRRLRRSEG